MNKIATTFFAAALIAFPVSNRAASPEAAQTRCTLTESPSIRGLKLGSTLEQVLARFPGSRKRTGMSEAIERAKSPTASEPVYLTFDPATDGSGVEFAGVDSVMVSFLKQRAASLNFIYVGATLTVDEWVANVSETLALPAPSSWMTGPSENPGKILRCGSFEIEAAVQGGGASINLRNLDSQGADAASKASEEKRKKDLKP